MIWSFNNKKLEFNGTPKIMGVVNITPDSFYDGGRYIDSKKAIDHALRLVEHGAHILDLGAESSRPGADPVGAEEELDRLLPVLTAIRKRSDILVSVDTCKPEVAEEAVKSGADIINDISGAANTDILRVAAENGVPIILMHMQGKPKTMQEKVEYENVIQEVTDILLSQVKKANSQGVRHVIVDPGIGFGKLLDHNMALMANIDYIKKKCKTPVLLGASRKSFIDHLLVREKEDRLAGSLAVAAWSVVKKVDIIRVHDVKETADVIAVMFELQKKSYSDISR